MAYGPRAYTIWPIGMAMAAMASGYGYDGCHFQYQYAMAEWQMARPWQNGRRARHRD